MQVSDNIDYKTLYEKTKKDLKALKSYTKVSMSTESNVSVQNKLLVQLLNDIYDQCLPALPTSSNSTQTELSVPKSLNFEEITDETYVDIKQKMIEAINSKKQQSRPVSVPSSPLVIRSTSPSVTPSPMDMALLETIQRQSNATTDISVNSGVGGDIDTQRAVYSEQDMNSALKKLRDEIIRTCEKEARIKVQVLQQENSQLQYALDLLGLELAEVKASNGQLCAECREPLVKENSNKKSCNDDVTAVTAASVSNANTKVKHNSRSNNANSKNGNNTVMHVKSTWVEYIDPNLPEPSNSDVAGDDIEPEPQPLPFGGLHSPVIERLLNEWTDDHNKIMYLTSWVDGLSKLQVLPAAFPRGLQIVEVNTMVRDGFLMLLLPLMRHMSLHKLILFTRTSAIRPSLSDVRAEAQRLSEAVAEAEALFDIRIKVLNEANEYYHPTLATETTSPTPSRQNSMDSYHVEGMGDRRRSSADLLMSKAGTELNTVFQNTVSGVFTLVNITQQSLGALATTMSGVRPQSQQAQAPTLHPVANYADATAGDINETPATTTPSAAALPIPTEAAAIMPLSAPPASVVSQWASFLGNKVISGMSGVPAPAPAAPPVPAAAATPAAVPVPAAAPAAAPALVTTPTTDPASDTSITVDTHLSVDVPLPVSALAAEPVTEQEQEPALEPAAVVISTVMPQSTKTVAALSGDFETNTNSVDTVDHVSSSGMDRSIATPTCSDHPNRSVKDKMNAKLAALRQKSTRR